MFPVIFLSVNTLALHQYYIISVLWYGLWYVNVQHVELCM